MTDPLTTGPHPRAGGALLRLADAAWDDPCDPTHAQRHGGRWNPPGSWPTLYLNDDYVTARANIVRLHAGSRVLLDDLRDDAPYVLVEVACPDGQRFARLHDDEEVVAAGLPPTYPLADGRTVPHDPCQQIAVALRDDGASDGLAVRSAATDDGDGRETAWFPPDADARPQVIDVHPFARWRHARA